MTRIRNRGLVLLAMLALPLLPARSSGAESRCGETADKLLSRAKSWADLRKWFTSYADCDDGDLADTVSEDVTVLLARQWQDLPSLEHEIKKEPRFRAFVLRHIDATTTIEDLEAVRRNAAQGCPARSSALCASIATAAQGALEEAKQPR
jgi:hypothetical protein